MKLELDRKILLDALRRVLFVGAPATRLDLTAGKLVATAAVSTCAARATVVVPEATTLENVAVTREVVRFLAESTAKRVEIETNDDGSTLFVADAARIRSRSPELLDFPKRDLVPVGSVVKLDDFRRAVRAASTLARRAVGSSLALETVRFDGSNEGEFAVVGTDGRALSVRVWSLASHALGAPESFGVDARLATRIASAFEGDLIQIRYFDGIAFFNGSDAFEVAATTNAERFPDWRKIVPTSCDRVAYVDREKFLRVVRAASATADEKRRVTLRFDATGLVATCVGAEIGASEVVESLVDGGSPFEFDVDPEALRFLESWSAPTVEIASNDPSRPFRVASPDGRELAAVMPLTQEKRRER